MESATFEEAFVVARDSYTPEMWETLKSSARATAIYRQMRRIDVERAALTLASDQSFSDVDATMSSDDPLYICFRVDGANYVMGALLIESSNHRQACDEARERWKYCADMNAIEVWLGDRMVYKASIPEHESLRPLSHPPPAREGGVVSC